MDPDKMNEQLRNEHVVGEKDLIGHIEASIVSHWNRDALTDYQGETLQYKDVARKIEKLTTKFSERSPRMFAKSLIKIF